MSVYLEFARNTWWLELLGIQGSKGAPEMMVKVLVLSLQKHLFRLVFSSRQEDGEMREDLKLFQRDNLDLLSHKL
jgi:hypothetical protein